MANSVYSINKNINKPIEFKGLKAQYIWYLGAGLVALLIMFAILYIIGVNTFICLSIILLLGIGLFGYVYNLSNKYGQYGMMKKVAMRKIPVSVIVYSRKVFTRLSNVKKKRDGKEVTGHITHLRYRT